MSGDSSMPQAPPRLCHSRLRRRAILFYLLALLAILLLFALILWNQQQRDLELGRERVAARADLVAEWVSATLTVGGHARGAPSQRLDPVLLDEALARLAMTRGESIALFDPDRGLITRRPSLAEGEVSEIPGQPGGGPLTRAFLASGEARTTLRTVSPLDGRERLYAVQRVGDRPLVVVVGEEVGGILAGWWQRFWLHLVLFLLLTALGGWLLRHYLGRLTLERALQDREEKLRIAASAFETHLGMLITDATGTILRVNDTFSRITGYAEAEVVGQNPRLLSSGLHDEAFYATLWARVARDGSWQGEIWNRRKGGQVYPEWLTISAVRDAAGRLTHYVATFSDLTERKAAEQEIHQLAFYDPLTGLPNRRLLLDRLEGTLKDSVRTGQFGALVFLDLDHFKRVNDTLGHQAGDLLLQRIAERFGEVLRETDTLARLGGDEFALLLHDLGHEADAVARLVERVAIKLQGVLEAPIRLAEERLIVTASLGITLFRDHETTLDEILQQADMALFQAKSAGRNALSFFDPEMQRRLQVRARLEGDLRQALPRGELRLHYQVQVDESGTVNGVEALLRWQHPQRGMVSPAEFIPLAEESRLIVPIGNWVLETACRQLAVWAADPRTARLTISVNVSARQFRESDFVERVLEILESTGAPAHRLTLEVTESLFVEERDDARDKMLRLRERGITFALDDFGTGYSSLAYLRRLPLDQLKVDQSFVRDLLEDEASMAIVASIIALSRSLKLEVFAEGVETEAQRAWLAEHGCRSFQGYLFGRPVPVEALALDG